MRISRREEIDRQFFTLTHLPEIWQIGTDNRDAKSTCQVCHSAASRGRRIRHYRDRGALKQIGQITLGDVAAKLDSSISRTLLAHGFDVARRLWMIASRDYQSSLWHLGCKKIERLDHQFKALVRSPFSERKYSMMWRTAA